MCHRLAALGTFALVVVAAPLAAQNLVTNGDFRSDASGWANGPQISSAWSSLDANGSSSSGSISLVSTYPHTNVSTGVTQCIAVVAGQTYHVSAKARIPSGQTAQGTAQAHLTFNSEPDCPQGSYLQQSLVVTVASTEGPLDSWRSAIASGVTPAAARSALVQCTLMKTVLGGDLHGSFDDVSVLTSLTRTLVVSSSASVHGQNQTFFHTDLWVKNRSYTNAIVVTATYRCQAGFTCAESRSSFTLAPRQSMLLADVVAGAFQRPETAGAIELSWDSANGMISAASRTYTPTLPEPTNGTAVTAEDAGAATRRVMFLGLGNNGGDRQAGFRSNAGAYNRGDNTGPVTFRLVDASGALLGETSRQAVPGQPFQVNDIFAAVGAGSVVTMNATLEVTATVPVHPFVTVIDNKSGDSVWVPASADEAP